MYFNIFFKFLSLIVPVLLGVAFITLLERKILGIVGLRLGPFKVSFLGILQPIFDAVKLANKQINIISNFSFFFYYISACLMFFSASFIWFCFFSEPCPVSFKYSLIILMIILGLNSLNSILAGWSTFSKYSLIGSLRTVAQLISYESVLYLILFLIVLFYSSFSIFTYTFFYFPYIFLICPYAIYIWIPSVLAELNRTPYDFSEGESELVSGFNTEFGSSSFTLIFLAEYSNIIFLSILTYIIFFFDFFIFWVILIFFFFIWIRSVLPRYRFDKLMMLAWKFFIPFSTLFFICCLMGFSF